jgi:hypothetical protein
VKLRLLELLLNVRLLKIRLVLRRVLDGLETICLQFGYRLVGRESRRRDYIGIVERRTCVA